MDQLTPKTKLNELLNQFPYLVEFLGQYNPKYAVLASPVLRNTLGRAATLGKVAALGGADAGQLLAAIRDKVKAMGGPELAVEVGSLPRTREERRAVLKGLIADLHAGQDAEGVKQRFNELIEDVGPAEIGEMEQELLAAGMPVTEIHRLCDVHADLMREGLEGQELPQLPAGHPVHTYIAENEALTGVAAKLDAVLLALGTPPEDAKLAAQAAVIEPLLADFAKVELHYVRKENQLFPRLEQHGASGPPQVMWAVHDDIRALLKQARSAFSQGQAAAFADILRQALKKFNDMVFKEHHILLPMALSIFSEEDWLAVRRGEEEIGFALVQPGTDWPPAGTAAPALQHAAAAPVVGPASAQAGVMLHFPTGMLSPEQALLLFNHLPVEISFTDETHTVRFFSQGKERIFPRSPGVIGRHVTKCHPPKSVHMVEEILRSFEQGSRDVAEFWLTLEGKLIHIRYFAIRDNAGQFRGTMEVVQDVTGIQRLAGERRLLQWE